MWSMGHRIHVADWNARLRSIIGADVIRGGFIGFISRDGYVTAKLW